MFAHDARGQHRPPQAGDAAVRRGVETAGPGPRLDRARQRSERLAVRAAAAARTASASLTALSATAADSPNSVRRATASAGASRR